MEKMLFISSEFEVFTSSWGVEVPEIPYKEGWIVPLGWEDELANRSIIFEEIEIENQSDELLYFDTAEDRDAFNSAESVFNGGNANVGYYNVGEDPNGYYVDLSSQVETLSFWNRFKNWLG